MVNAVRFAVNKAKVDKFGNYAFHKPRWLLEIVVKSCARATLVPSAIRREEAEKGRRLVLVPFFSMLRGFPRSRRAGSINGPSAGDAFRK